MMKMKIVALLVFVMVFVLAAPALAAYRTGSAAGDAAAYGAGGAAIISAAVVGIEIVDDTLIMGEAEINKSLIELLSKKGIMLHFFDHFGKYTGTYSPPKHKNSGQVFLPQAAHWLMLWVLMRLTSWENLREPVNFIAEAGLRR